MKAKGNKLSYSKVKDISLLPALEVPIDEDVLDEFEESGMSPLEAIKKAQEPAKDKNLISIDQQINQQIKLPSIIPAQQTVTLPLLSTYKGSYIIICKSGAAIKAKQIIIIR